MRDSGRHRNKGWRRIALPVLACALLFRLLVPAGWMPDSSAAGVTLRWCSEGTSGAQAEAQALLAKAMGEKPAPKHSAAPDTPCTFAAASAPLLSADTVAELAPSAGAPVPAPVAVLIPVPGQGLSAPPPPQTGPPLLA